jgi:hypothetical protein
MRAPSLPATTEVETLPEAFCWTRFGAEAGEEPDAILSRKESERRSAGGIFLWGIGNAVGRSLLALAQTCNSPEVLFSPIAGRPQAEDRGPRSVVRWRSGDGLNGVPFDLPPGAWVTSRVGSRPRHYALVCSSDSPLDQQGDSSSLDMAALINLVSGRPVGSSQTTAVVRQDPTGSGGRRYPVVVRAQLISPYLIRLRDPAVLF